jgi:hypothetical protein
MAEGLKGEPMDQDEVIERLTRIEFRVNLMSRSLDILLMALAIPLALILWRVW